MEREIEKDCMGQTFRLHAAATEDVKMELEKRYILLRLFHIRQDAISFNLTDYARAEFQYKIRETFKYPLLSQ